MLALLPGLLDAVHAARAARPGRVAETLLVPLYGLAALVLVKVGQGSLAWLAADRGMAVAMATNDPTTVAAATVPLAQALRCDDRPRYALETALVAAHRLMPAAADGGPAGPAGAALLGTLLIQAALAAAERGDEDGVRTLLDQAAELPRESGAGDGGFGPAAVGAARVVAEAALGDVAAAAVRHEQLIAGERWRWLPPEHRAAYLVDVARAYARVDDMFPAGRALLLAERTAPGEVHDRPPVRTLVATVSRSPAAPPAFTRLTISSHRPPRSR
ncbi:hypothetical protein [Micromonospora cathayae]|uniref:Uncharacterized protein n=1 Tax=Micromonospora cathayae TaxID=3028804 RepID=A0ABY7ZXT5_9ACTN|nr:hypothetical protein [Micromonospora sp. HUAS 3]WDZ87842.1 hypothetical protein PVK37_16250 [Micromonospora sp. HUAS 3]